MYVAHTTPQQFANQISSAVCPSLTPTEIRQFCPLPRRPGSDTTVQSTEEAVTSLALARIISTGLFWSNLQLTHQVSYHSYLRSTLHGHEVYNTPAVSSTEKNMSVLNFPDIYFIRIPFSKNSTAAVSHTRYQVPSIQHNTTHKHTTHKTIRYFAEPVAPAIDAFV